MARSPAYRLSGKGRHDAARGAPCQNDVLLAEIGEGILEFGRDDAVVLDDELFGQRGDDEMPRGHVVGEVGRAGVEDQPGNEVAHSLAEPAARRAAR